MIFTKKKLNMMWIMYQIARIYKKGSDLNCSSLLLSNLVKLWFHLSLHFPIFMLIYMCILVEFYMYIYIDTWILPAAFQVVSPWRTRTISVTSLLTSTSSFHSFTASMLLHFYKFTIWYNIKHTCARMHGLFTVVQHWKYYN